MTTIPLHIRTAASAALPLFGRRLQIAGSASAKTDPVLVRYGHEIIASVVTGVMKAGGGIVAGLGKEPRPEGASADAQASSSIGQ